MSLDELGVGGDLFQSDDVHDDGLVGVDELLEELDARPREPVVEDAAGRLLLELVDRLGVGVQEQVNAVLVDAVAVPLELVDEWRQEGHGHVEPDGFDARRILGQALEKPCENSR